MERVDYGHHQIHAHIHHPHPGAPPLPFVIPSTISPLMNLMASYKTNIAIDQPTNPARCETVFGRFKAGKWAHIITTD